MKRLFVAGLLFVFMAVVPVFHAVANDNQICDGQIENYVSATGTVVQNGTPTPDTPIEPVFYTQGDMVLRKVGDIADSYDAATGKITRRVGVKVLDGTESWDMPGSWQGTYPTFRSLRSAITNSASISADRPAVVYSSNFTAAPISSASFSPVIDNTISVGSTAHTAQTLWIRTTAYNNVADFKTWLSQYPVTVYYPLATSVEEDWPSSYCQPSIKIATTAYNTARFSPVKTDLDSAVATIREIVTKTINQTAAIASLQADKQTRPEDACPAGKKCLLVETEENGVIVPHWFPIIEAPDDN